MIGKILSFPFRLANVPFRALEKIFSPADDVRALSKPLEKLAEAIEEVDKP